jgi:CheY-like chemotaxis protein
MAQNFGHIAKARLSTLKSGELILIEDKSMTKILLVDDDTVTLNSIFKCLSEFGYDVVSACDGSEGFQKFLENHFDLIITDIVMPKMDGTTLVENIRNDSNSKYIPAIAIATYPCIQEYSPFDAFFRKPLSVEKLFDAIEKGTHKMTGNSLATFTR